MIRLGVGSFYLIIKHVFVSLAPIMDKVRIGVIGIGSMGSTHTRTILSGKVKGLEVTALADADSARLKQFPDVKGFNDPIEMMDSGLVDAVLIATPHYDHKTLGIAALERGLHTLVEKPISVHKADCEKLIAAYKDPKVVFAAMFNVRLDLRYQKLKQLIDSGELGKINRISWIVTNWFRSEFYYRSGSWRATWAGEGGGVLLNQCPHQLDLLQWLFGMPKKIQAFCHLGKYHDIEVEDEVTAYLEYENGSTGVFITSTGEAPGTNRLEIAAERGRVVVEGTKIEWIRNEVETSKWTKEAQHGFLPPPVWNIDIPLDVANITNGAHSGIMQNFVNAILRGEKLVAPAVEGIHSVELANAMLYSSHIGQAITLPLDSAAYEKFLQEKIKTSSYVKKDVKASVPTDISSSFNR